MGSPIDWVVDWVDMAIVFAAGAGDFASSVDSVFSVVALTVSAVWVCFSPACSTVAVGSVVDDFCFSSVVGGAVSVGAGISCVGVVAPESVWLCSGGFGFSVVGSVVAVGVEVELDDVEPVEDDEVSPETVVPDPPEALTVDVGPSPAVVVDDCEPDDEVVVVVVVVVVVGSVPVVAPGVPDVPPEPEDVVPDSVVVEAFDPVSVSGGPEVEFSVVADAMPCPVVATAMPSPAAMTSPLARLALAGRFACFPRFDDDMTCSRLPRVADHASRQPGHDMLINCGET